VAGHDPLIEPGSLDAYCPLRLITPDYPPTLLLHGDQDTDVPYEQSLQMHAALREAGVDAQLITIPDGVHGFDRQQATRPEVVVAFDQVLAMLRTCLEEGNG